MRTPFVTGAVAAVAVCAFALSNLEAASPSAMGTNLVVQVKGTSVAETRDIDTDGDGIVDTTADCYEIQLYDPRTGHQIGTATDCLSDIDVPIDDDPGTPPMGWNLALTGTTFFHLPGGTLVTQGLTTVRPVLHPTAQGGVDFTHTTGANGDGGFQYGTGKFAPVSSGTARLSGLVDLSRLVSDSEITFDCLFVIDLQN